MVSRLADMLVERYASNATRILDPFCGSGAILVAAARRGIPATGMDINPIAELFSRVKLKGFNAEKAFSLAHELISTARETIEPLPIEWASKHYWFTPSTLRKFEKLRRAAHELNLYETTDGIAVLMSLSLSVRLCSKADQRSPKPFISKEASEKRKGKHYDPYSTMLKVLSDLAASKSCAVLSGESQFMLADITRQFAAHYNHSHVITSPPYINAQDYFRNFKLELYILEGLLPYRVDTLRTAFVGTERGDLLERIPDEVLTSHVEALTSLKRLARQTPRLAAVVHRYLHDMSCAFKNISRSLKPDGKLILVCGDNLIGGIRIRTWQVLSMMLEQQGFHLFDTFADPIVNRMLAPKRCGHKGLIKEEVVCAFQKCLVPRV